MSSQESDRNSQFDKATAEHAYPKGIEKGFWSIARHALIESTIRHSMKLTKQRPQGLILEVGCGPGIVVDALRSRRFDVWGVELGSPEVLENVVDFVITGAEAQNLDIGFRDRVSTILLLDVIEHIRDDSKFLKMLTKAYRNCNCFIITVPAQPELWSEYDIFYGHFRRYTLSQLEATLRKANLEPLKTRFFFRSLYLIALFMKILGIRRRTKLKAPRFIFAQKVIAMLLKLEDCLMRSLPIRGLSLVSIVYVADREFKSKG